MGSITRKVMIEQTLELESCPSCLGDIVIDYPEHAQGGDGFIVCRSCERKWDLGSCLSQWDLGDQWNKNRHRIAKNLQTLERIRTIWLMAKADPEPDGTEQADLFTELREMLIGSSPD